MRPGWQIGTIFGIPLLIDSSWFIILALFTAANAARFEATGIAGGLAWVTGLVLALLLFSSVLLHELGHSLVARSQGIKVNSITLFIFGGVASIDRESKTPGQAFQVAIAGPAVSFALFILLSTVDFAFSLTSPAVIMVRDLAQINGILAIFNLIPGLPLDGGQVLKAAVWKVTGSRLAGLRWAANAGKMLGWAAIILGVTLYFQVGFGGLWIALLGWFVVSNATSYSRIADLQEALSNIQAETVMTREFRVVDADLSLQRFTEGYLVREEGRMPAFFAASDGRYRGQIVPEELNQIERSRWETQTLQSIVHPLSDIPSVSETSPITEAIDKLESLELQRITVLSPAGAVSGVIDRGDIVRALAEKLKVVVPDAMIQRIKDEGKFPPGLPLMAIARSVIDEED